MVYERLIFRQGKGIRIKNDADLSDKQIIYNALLRLAELEDKIENGTFIEMPCRVGDTMYQVSDLPFGDSIIELVINGIYWEKGKVFVDCSNRSTSLIHLPLNDFFMTRKEAENKWAETLKEHNNAE